MSAARDLYQLRLYTYFTFELKIGDSEKMEKLVNPRFLMGFLQVLSSEEHAELNCHFRDLENVRLVSYMVE